MLNSQSSSTPSAFSQNRIQFISVLLALLLVRPAFATAAENGALNTLPPTPRAADTEPDPDSTAPDDPLHQPILPSLKGLRLIDAAEKAAPGGADTQGIAIENLPTLEDPVVRRQLGAFIQKPLSLSSMQEIIQLIETWYLDHGGPVVVISLPKQDSNNGTVQILVQEMRLGNIKVEGNKAFSSELIRSAVRFKPGDIVYTAALQKDIDRLNENPFRSVDFTLDKGEQPGTIDITLKTVDQLPLRVYGVYDNAGQQATGRARWSQGVNWGNVFGLDHQLTYQITESTDFWSSRGGVLNNPWNARSLANSLVYDIPLPWHDRLSLTGAYLQAHPEMGGDLSQTAHSFQLGLLYSHPLSALSWLKHDIHAGYDFKTSDASIDASGQRIFDSTYDVNQFYLGYKATESDAYGQTTLENNLFLSPGGLTAHNNTEAFQQAGSPFAKANYVYDRIELSRQTPLPAGLSWVMRAEAQLSSSNLPATEQLVFGGSTTVRGYEVAAALGSNGFLLNQELWSPAFSVSPTLFGHDLGDKTQTLVFWDYSETRDNTRLPQNAETRRLQSVGLGLKSAIGEHFSFRFDYGFQLNKAPNEEKLGQFGYISAVIQF